MSEFEDELEQEIEDLSALEDTDADVEEEIGEGDETLSKLMFEHKGIVYRLKLDYSCESVFATAPESLRLDAGDYVVVAMRYGRDIARVQGQVTTPYGIPHKSEIMSIERKATEIELKKQESYKLKEEEAHKVFQEKAAARCLNMKLLVTHCLFDGSKMLFLYSSNDRVDFRELVKDLVGVFRTRIELRQIGVRDVSRIAGGIGMCGRCLCCHSMANKLPKTTIKMAKEQNLSLNSMKISGQCGMLLCCLHYECQWYSEARKTLPPEGLRLSYDGTGFRVTAINLITRVVQISGEDGRVLDIPAARFVQTGGVWRITD